MAGDIVAQSRAHAELVELAEMLGAARSDAACAYAVAMLAAKETDHAR